jgi:methyl-accepting chemotaxis protein
MNPEMTEHRNERDRTVQALFVLLLAALAAAFGLSFLAGGRGVVWSLVVATGASAGLLLRFRELCSSPARVISEWLESLDREGAIDIRKRVEAPSGSPLYGVAQGLNGFVGKLREVFLSTIRGLHGFTFNFFRLERELSAFVDTFSEITTAVDTGVVASNAVGDAVSTQYASSEEISSTAQALARLAAELNETVSSVTEKAESGRVALEEMNRSIGGIGDGVENLTSMAKELAEKVSVIGSVVRTITGIAEQTNLLALNASIEAARAGGAGRGFAVVADEVRNLAEESKRAAAQIGGSLEELVQDVRRTSSEADAISAGMKDSGRIVTTAVGSFGEILSGVRAIGDASERVAASAQELSASSEELAATAETASKETETMRGEFSVIGSSVGEIAKMAEALRTSAGRNAVEAGILCRGLRAVRAMTDRDFSDIAKAAVEAHKTWIMALGKMMSEGSGSVETDPARCRFGVFLSLVDRPDVVPDALWSRVLSLHEELHRTGHAVTDALRKKDRSAAGAGLRKAQEISSTLVSLFGEVIALCGGGSDIPGLPAPGRSLSRE